MLWCLDVIMINVSRVHWCRQVGHGRIRVQIKRGGGSGCKVEQSSSQRSSGESSWEGCRPSSLMTC
jgi:hypothetical protein